jgi:hypothetical protein
MSFFSVFASVVLSVLRALGDSAVDAFHCHPIEPGSGLQPISSLPQPRPGCVAF